MFLQLYVIYFMILFFLCTTAALSVSLIIQIRKKAKALQYKEAFCHDYLTGLSSRQAAEIYICGALNRLNTAAVSAAEMPASAPSNEIVAAFMILDLDHFKEVNDTKGHMAGDELLRQVGQTLKNSVRVTDMVGRLGGDEFLIYLAPIDSEDIFCQKANQICEAVRLLTKDTAVTVSIGITPVFRSGGTFHDLYEKADAALYKAKESGRDCYYVG